MFGAAPATAGIITGSTLLDDAGATQLETWLGQGDLDWNSEWYGVTGDTASSWHTAVDGIGATVTIYDIVWADGSHSLIGGYTALDWGAASAYYDDPNSFIFNLTSPEIQYSEAGFEGTSIYTNPDYFATFGGGHDLFAGFNGLLANGLTSIANAYSGMTYVQGYDHSQGQISVAGDSGNGHGDSGINAHYSFAVTAAETFTFGAAAQIPEPGTLAVFGMGLMGLGINARRRRRAA